MDYKAKHFEDLARRASQSRIPMYTSFLSPLELSQALSIAKRMSLKVQPFGGYAEAERQILAYFSYEEPSFPIAIIKITAKQKTHSFQHRQVLGSLLSLGIKREVLGDILLASNKAYVFCLNSHSQLIVDAIYKIGSMSVSLELVDEVDDNLVSSSVHKRVSLSSLRLDACLAGALNLSRSRASSLVESGNVYVNYSQEIRPDFKLDENAVISVRSYGRIIIRELLPLNKKGKQPAVIECFLKK